MSSKVIQLARLEEFVEEDLRAGDLVRVVVLDVTESVSSQIPSLRTAGVGVHVRVITEAGHILGLLSFDVAQDKPARSQHSVVQRPSSGRPDLAEL